MSMINTRLLRIAAASGAFDPAALAFDYPAEALEMLADVCDEDIAGRQYRWRLRAGARRQALNAIPDAGTLRATLRMTPEPSAGDDFGLALRRVLARKPTRRLAAASLNAAHACHTALTFAHDMPLFAPKRESIAAEIAQLRQTIAGQDRQHALDVVLPKGRRLFGRGRELLSIAAFASGVGDVRPLVISGMGGIGKSALIAAIMRDAERAPGWSAILLDFDRPTLLNGEPYEIVREIARQMASDGTLAGRGDRKAGAELRAALSALRGRLSSRTVVPAPPPESAHPTIAMTPQPAELRRLEPEGQLAQLKTEHFETLRALPLHVRQHPVLLIMDTFELITGLSVDVVRRVLRVEEMLRIDAGCSGFRAVLAGRALATSMQPFAEMLSPADSWIRLEGLEAKAGAALLAAVDHKGRLADAAMRRRAAEALKGHPLALQIFSRYCQDRSDREIRSLVDDMSANPDFQAEFAQRFLYSRILDRIPDPRLKALAHPGLVLRHVTPDLIRLVLAGPCNLGALDSAASLKLFEMLAKNHWLVSHEAPQRVRHLPELRQHMLAAMLAPVSDSDSPANRRRKTELREKARLVSLAALALYRDGPPPGDPARGWWEKLSDAERHTEVLYHRALTEPAPARMQRADAAQLRTGIGEDFDSLPRAWSALVKAETDNLASLSADERRTLKGGLRERATKQRLETLDKAGAFEAVAMEAVQESARRAEVKKQERVHRSSAIIPAGAAAPESPAVEPPVSSDLDLAAQTTRAAFMRGNIEQAAAEGAPLISAFLAGAEYFAKAPARHFGGDDRFWLSGLWLGALAQAAMGGNLLLARRQVTDFGAKFADETASILILNAVLDDADGSSAQEYVPLISRSATPRGDYAMPRLLALAMKLHPELFPFKQDGYLLTASAPFATLAMLHAETREWIDTVTGPDDLAWPEDHFTLRGLEQFYKSLSNRRLPVDKIDAPVPVIAGILRGLTPELHTPCAAMLDAMPPPAAAGLVQAMARQASHWPADLAFDDDSAAPSRKRFGPGDAMTVVITADRCGILPRLLESLSSFDSRAALLERVHETITSRLFAVADAGLAAAVSDSKIVSSTPLQVLKSR